MLRFIVQMQLSSSLCATTARPFASRRLNTTLCCPRPLCITTLEVRFFPNTSVGSQLLLGLRLGCTGGWFNLGLVWWPAVTAVCLQPVCCIMPQVSNQRAMMIRNIKLNRPDLRRDVVMIAPCSQCLERKVFLRCTEHACHSCIKL